MGVCDSESVTRTSAGSRNMVEMRMRNEKLAISPQGVIRSTLCLVPGFWGRRIEWIYFWLNQISNDIWVIQFTFIKLRAAL